ncbi:MFS transporter [Streptomyces mirabilis]|uniref:MFS transporter n=1 Tax=Streptomyces mirabilis TaxID=68239 RepID=UPI00332BC290
MRTLKIGKSQLSPLARRLVIGQMFIGFGYGLITPSWFLYLDQVRGFGAGVAGASFALRAIGMTVIAPLAGWMVDWRGPRSVVLAGTVFTIVGAAGLGLSPWAGPCLVGSLLIGAGTSCSVPATRVVLLNAVPDEQRSYAAASSFTMYNVGLGTGSLVGGFVVDPDSLLSFVMMFLAYGLLAIVTRLVNLPAMPANAVNASPARSGRMSAAIRSPGFLWYLAAALALQFAGYGQSTAGLPGLGTTLLNLSTSTIGFALACNTATILLISPVTLRFAQRLRSNTSLSLVGLLWAVGWALVACGTVTERPRIVAGSIIAFYVLFGVGQALLAAVATPLIAGLAPPGTLGTHLGLDTLTRQIGGALGPAVSGAMIADRAVLPYLTLCLGMCLTVPFLAFPLRRRISPSIQNATAKVAVETSANPTEVKPNR